MIDVDISPGSIGSPKIIPLRSSRTTKNGISSPKFSSLRERPRASGPRINSFSKDSDQNIRLLLNITPKGAPGPKFRYVSDLDELGKTSANHGAINRKKVFEAMPVNKWISAPILPAT